MTITMRLLSMINSKNSLRIWIYSECLQNEIMVFGNNFINFTIDKLSK